MTKAKKFLFAFFIFIFYQTNNQTCKIVLSGGPGVGKSEIIKHLRARHCVVKPEGFAHLWKKAKEENRLAELFANGTELQKKLVTTQERFEACAKKTPLIFFDRGMVDIIVFSKIFQHIIEPKVLKIAEQAVYDLVFIVEPLPKEYYRQAESREESYEESLERHNLLVEAYQQYWLKLEKDPNQFMFYVPAPTEVNMSEEQIQESISQRTEFILDMVETKLSTAPFFRKNE